MTFKVSHMDAWPRPRTRAEFEAALEAGRLYAQMSHKRFWLVRRDGPTLVTPEGAWHVHVRAGLTGHGEASQRTLTVYRVRPRHATAKAQIRLPDRP